MSPPLDREGDAVTAATTSDADGRCRAVLASILEYRGCVRITAPRDSRWLFWTSCDAGPGVYPCAAKDTPLDPERNPCSTRFISFVCCMDEDAAPMGVGAAGSDASAREEAYRCAEVVVRACCRS